jgi:hypothetical protein
MASEIAFAPEPTAEDRLSDTSLLLVYALPITMTLATAKLATLTSGEPLRGLGGWTWMAKRGRDGLADGS